MPDLNKINPYYGDMDLRLTSHPQTPCDAISSIEVACSMSNDGFLTFVFVVSGDVSALLIPASNQAVRQDELWKHTCFELFAGPPNRKDYVEYNFSPSSEWAAYSFSDCRTGIAPLDVTQAPRISRNTGRDRFELCVSGIARPFEPGAIEIGLSAVIEETNGRLSYWALSHPADTPDFHHRGGFVLDANALEIS